MNWFLIFVACVVAFGAYKIWRINRRPSQKEIIRSLIGFRNAVEAAKKDRS